MALALGVPHPSRLREVLTAEEWEDWRAFYEARPFGEYAQDARFAMLAVLVASALNGERHKVEDFMLARPPRPAPRYEDIVRVLKWASLPSRGATR